MSALLGAIDLLYAVPLLVAYSLVRAATRYEDRRLILMGAVRSGALMTGLLLVAFLILAAMDAAL